MFAIDLRGLKPTATIGSRYAAKTKEPGSYFDPRCYAASNGGMKTASGRRKPAGFPHERNAENCPFRQDTDGLTPNVRRDKTPMG